MIILQVLTLKNCLQCRSLSKRLYLAVPFVKTIVVILRSKHIYSLKIISVNPKSKFRFETGTHLLVPLIPHHCPTVQTPEPMCLEFQKKNRTKTSSAKISCDLPCLNFLKIINSSRHAGLLLSIK